MSKVAAAAAASASNSENRNRLRLEKLRQIDNTFQFFIQTYGDDDPFSRPVNSEKSILANSLKTMKPFISQLQYFYNEEKIHLDLLIVETIQCSVITIPHNMLTIAAEQGSTTTAEAFADLQILYVGLMTTIRQWCISVILQKEFLLDMLQRIYGLVNTHIRRSNRNSTQRKGGGGENYYRAIRGGGGGGEAAAAATTATDNANITSFVFALQALMSKVKIPEEMVITNPSLASSCKTLQSTMSMLIEGLLRSKQVSVTAEKVVTTANRKIAQITNMVLQDSVDENPKVAKVVYYRTLEKQHGMELSENIVRMRFQSYNGVGSDLFGNIDIKAIPGMHHTYFAVPTAVDVNHIMQCMKSDSVYDDQTSGLLRLTQTCADLAWSISEILFSTTITKKTEESIHIMSRIISNTNMCARRLLDIGRNRILHNKREVIDEEARLLETKEKEAAVAAAAVTQTMGGGGGGARRQQTKIRRRGRQLELLPLRQWRIATMRRQRRIHGGAPFKFHWADRTGLRWINNSINAMLNNKLVTATLFVGSMVGTFGVQRFVSQLFENKVFDEGQLIEFLKNFFNFKGDLSDPKLTFNGAIRTILWNSKGVIIVMVLLVFLACCMADIWSRWKEQSSAKRDAWNFLEAQKRKALLETTHKISDQQRAVEKQKIIIKQQQLILKNAEDALLQLEYDKNDKGKAFNERQMQYTYSFPFTGEFWGTNKIDYMPDALQLVAHINSANQVAVVPAGQAAVAAPVVAPAGQAAVTAPAGQAAVAPAGQAAAAAATPAGQAAAAVTAPAGQVAVVPTGQAPVSVPVGATVIVQQGLLQETMGIIDRLKELQTGHAQTTDQINNIMQNHEETLKILEDQKVIWGEQLKTADLRAQQADAEAKEAARKLAETEENLQNAIRERDEQLSKIQQLQNSATATATATATTAQQAEELNKRLAELQERLQTAERELEQSKLTATLAQNDASRQADEAKIAKDELESRLAIANRQITSLNQLIMSAPPPAHSTRSRTAAAAAAATP